jgi:hypothetical protein
MRKLFCVIALFTLSVSCKKNDDVPVRKVNYAVTGVYGGKLNIVYTNARGQNDTAKSVSTPWSAEITVADTVRRVSFFASTDTTKTAGSIGQKITAIMVTGGIQRAQDTVTAPASGRIQTKLMTYSF